MEYELNLQMFADPGADGKADTVVNGTLGHLVNGTYQNPEATEAEIKVFYEKALITLAEPNLVHDQFAQKVNIPRRGGKSVEFRKFSKLPKALKPLTEGVTPQGSKISVGTIIANVDQYGDYIETTDDFELTAIDNVVVENTKMLASQAGLTFDTIVRNELNAGTNVLYCPKDNGKGSMIEVTSRKDIDSSCHLRVKDIFKAAAILKRNNAPKIDGSYVAIIHPFVAYDIMTEAGEKWMDIQKYTNNVEKIFNGEIGKIGGVRFVESTEALIIAPSEISEGFNKLHLKSAVSSSSTSVTVEEELEPVTFAEPVAVYVDGVENTIVKIEAASGGSKVTLGTAVNGLDAGALICGTGAGKDGTSVFSTIVLAENAYGSTSIEGGGLEHIAKPKGYGNDPLNQRSSVGWKGHKGAKILIEEYILRLESAVEDFFDADAN